MTASARILYYQRHYKRAIFSTALTHGQLKILFRAFTSPSPEFSVDHPRLLLERGHELHLLAERRDATDGQKMADILAADHPSITFEPLSHGTALVFAGHRCRCCVSITGAISIFRWDHAPKLRARAAEQTPALAIKRGSRPGTANAAGLAVLSGLFRGIERAMPPPDEVADVFRRIAPDALLLTPLLYFRSHQVDHVRCARQLGIKSALGVGSWII